jgi:hypothetical protein
MERHISPLKLSKTGETTPKAFLKNHSKSQKNHKMENPVVLDTTSLKCISRQVSCERKILCNKLYGRLV